MFSLGCPKKSFCQKEGNIGIFGNGVGLDFSYSPVQSFVVPKGNFNFDESCAAVSDKNGTLLFYTDGGIVYNREHDVMRNGYRIGGGDYNSTTTQTVIVPKPNSTFLYYVFSAGYQGRDLKYSLIDMSLNAGLGGVVFKDSLLYKQTTEKLYVVRASPGNWLWVITHEYATNVFRTFRVTENGLDTVSVRSAVGEVQVKTMVGGSATGYLKASPSGNRLAAAVSDLDGKQGLLELFDFDKATGKVSNAMKLFTSTRGDSYGVEFSPDETKLYHSRIGSRQLYQYDLTAGSLQNIINSATLIGSVWGAVQRAPDGKIYTVSTMNSTYLDVINNPNAKGTACNFQKDAVFLKGKTVLLGLPVFFYDIIYPEIIIDSFCENEPVKFNLLQADNVLNATWDFGDPLAIDNTSNLINPLHVFSNAGSYVVTATVLFKNNTSAQYKSTMVIFDKVDITLGPDIGLCVGTQFLVKVNPSSTSLEYVWQDGSRASSFLVGAAGKYWVKVSDEHCTSIDTLNVYSRDKPFFNLPDTSKCKNEDLSIAIAIPDTRFSWADGFQGGTRSLGQTGTYSITAENLCGTYTDQFTVSDLPDLHLDLGKDVILCKDTPVELNVFTASASYRWSDDSFEPVRSIDKPGVYWVNVFNHCTSLSDTINIQYLDKESIRVPNVITPNGDNINDQFVIDESLNSPPISIFNRWGNLVYSSDEYKNNWQGADLNTGHYYYTIRNTCLNEGIKGWIHLLK